MQKIIITLVLVFSVQCLLLAQNSKINPNKRLSVYQTASLPLIDGFVDEVWDDMEANPINTPLIFSGINNANDNSAYFKITWDSAYCYLLVVIKDDSIYNFNTTAHFNDNLELYFDMDNSKSKLLPPNAPWPATAYDSDDYQLRIVAGSSKEYAPEKLTFVQSATTGEYIIEAKILWKSLTDVSIGAGSIIGFDLIVADNDGMTPLPDSNGAGRDGITSWNSPTNEAWHDPSLFGTIVLSDASIPKTTEAKVTAMEPIIDAEVDSLWSNVAGVKLENIVSTSSTGITGDDDFSCTYKTMWDAQNFYLLLEVTDDILFTGETDTYKNDNVEVYFDLDNSKNPLMPRNAGWPANSFDNNDNQIRFNYGSNLTELLHGKFLAGNASLISLAQKDVEGGYVIEAKIPWIALGYLNMEAPKTIGFDLLFSDNDGDGRNQITWNTLSTNIWHDASLFGNMKLTGTPNAKSLVTVDGQTEPVWDLAEADVIAKKVSIWNVTDGSDLSASFKTLWDSKNFYLYLTVKDDSIITSMTNVWDNDNVEIYFDLDDSRNDAATGFDAFDKQVRLVAQGNSILGITGGEYSYKRIGKEYVMEVAIPWAKLNADFIPQVGAVIGFDMLLSDNDDGVNRDALGWNTASYDVWKDASLFGELRLNASGTMEKLSSRAVGAINFYVSVTGNDNNNGLTPELPFKSPIKAMGVALPGDTINFMTGTFVCNGTSFLTINQSGTPEKWITYRTAPGQKPKIKVTGSVWNTITIEADYIVIDGIEFEGDVQKLNLTDAEAAEADAEAGGSNWNYYATFNTNAITLGGNNSKGNHHMIVRNCVVHDFPGAGIASIKADYLTVENNVVYNNCWYTMYAGSGISLWHLYNSDTSTEYKNFVRGNFCHDNKTLVKWVSLGRYSDGNGIIIDDNKNEQDGAIPGVYSGKTLVENNICFNNGGSGIHAYNCVNVDIVNNTAYNNGVVPQVAYPEIYQGDCKNGKVMNNIMYAGKGGKVNSNYNNTNVTYDYNLYFNGTIAKRGTHDKEADPQFLNLSTDPSKADFHLTSGSPAVDAGTKEIFASVDFDGRQRPMGNGVDCGAYESDFSTNISKMEKKYQLEMYPNPTKSFLTIKLNYTDEIQDINLYNLTGDLVRSFKNVKDNQCVVNLSNFPQGIYFIQVNSRFTSEISKIEKQ